MKCSSPMLGIPFLAWNLSLMQAPHAVTAQDEHANSSKRFADGNLSSLPYLHFPRRTQVEAAVLEWGNSAVISALDASVAYFGPQTDQAALLEVECKPILASPLTGSVDADGGSEDRDERLGEPQKLLNADEVEGNMVVMTNGGVLSYVQMAEVAKISGAAALLVVNVNDKRPDDIFRMDAGQQELQMAKDIDIPVIMVSLNSANVLTTATVDAGMTQEEIVNHGMPDRVRLYAAGDRPFFEDVEPAEPTLYLIHNLLTDDEVRDVRNRVEALQPKIPSSVGGIDLLQLYDQPEKSKGVDRLILWEGMLQSQSRKASEERIEQVTGFPTAHFSDFVVDRVEPGGHWLPHYDTFGGDASGSATVPIATITVFLSDAGGPIVYPSGKEPIKISPQRGMAVVHHNSNDHANRHVDLSTLHAMLPNSSDEPVYVARKYVFATPISTARRMVLPFVAMLGGGRLPQFISTLFVWFCTTFGTDNGPLYFDKVCIFVPVLVVLALAQYLVEYVQGKWKKEESDGRKVKNVTKKSATSKAKKNK